MHLPKLAPDPSGLVDFFQEALEHLGALCERTWFDRLQVVADGPAAKPWNDTGALHETELHFVTPDSTAPRDAAHDVFPGCPLTFRIAELLLSRGIELERAILAPPERHTPPSAEVAEKLWHSQWPSDARWRLTSAFAPAHHFSMVALVRCEIQAIDQHWSLHRLARSLPNGERDESLAHGLDFAGLTIDSPTPPPWPHLDPAHLSKLLHEALQEELVQEIHAIRARQENYLRRELQRVDDYFHGYAAELEHRTSRSHNRTTKLKAGERLAAAQAEHARRREDQIHRHEIRVLPRVDALLVVAEPAWTATVAAVHRGQTCSMVARFLPRARRWFRTEPNGSEALPQTSLRP